ncbi:MAG: UDP-N-acetylglucosamine 2-epimerase (non-hydrolyzing) [Planctomycetes bacterium]|nr:UDP-N-acetylglucosamine 2-epimerase (non-hydrolyzing) [Planctomycetota bacterium]
MKIINIIGTRPNFIKIAPFMQAAKKYPRLKMKLVHTGQHYDYNMSKVFFKNLAIPKPDIYLGTGSGSQGAQTGQMMIALEKIVLKEKPDLIVVLGDVNSTLAASLVAAKLTIPIAHIEAGVRSFDRAMPEEINRLVTDSLSDLLFTPSDYAVKNLTREGVARQKIFNVGNIMMDTLFANFNKIKQSQICRRLDLKPQTYAAMTLHRPSNVDDKKTFTGILKALNQIKKSLAIIWPIHPRARKQTRKFNLDRFFVPHRPGRTARIGQITLLDPLAYTESLGLFYQARFVLTDSGGVQTETTALNTPCLTLRYNTEWLETLSQGTNTRIDPEPRKIINAANKILRRPIRKKPAFLQKSKLPKYWDGKTSQRIIKIILDKS